ncbi:Arf GTPase activating protein [Acanthamoeba castellanii str. Neff]|uniref:Arf GTPase activating protein n=1 Tax=Acanthamoeba castellanii (strain ATCC 30010 / Neff) TaxID=1257118 RepID=L8HHA4_ACACF|nr:Arf GTPase activating protein [Acanthamoeba castellanii str. Neff]ELR24550.1 Arf GTPase activating protein [Acanthamoeba castellanii str. Neff]
MNKKQLDEKHQKILRKLLTLPENKKCFDCSEKGPFYACTTLGTFVCTTCSGIHREFQHHVKSISMASFKPEEVQFLEEMGNGEIWLAYWTPSDYPEPESTDRARVREFMKLKYERKKWHDEEPPRVEPIESILGRDIPPISITHNINLPLGNNGGISGLESVFTHPEPTKNPMGSTVWPPPAGGVAPAPHMGGGPGMMPAGGMGAFPQGGAVPFQQVSPQGAGMMMPPHIGPGAGAPGMVAAYPGAPVMHPGMGGSMPPAAAMGHNPFLAGPASGPTSGGVLAPAPYGSSGPGGAPAAHAKQNDASCWLFLCPSAVRGPGIGMAASSPSPSHSPFFPTATGPTPLSPALSPAMAPNPFASSAPAYSSGGFPSPPAAGSNGTNAGFNPFGSLI